jgi:hypothetical protein
MKKTIMCLLIATSIVACKDSENSNKENPEMALENDKNVTINTNGEWQYLFDGTSLEGWRAYGEEGMPPGWTINNKELTYDTELGLEDDYKGGRDIIYGAEEFENFELSLEWKLPEGGNSGIFYHIKEGYESMSKVAPEYQLIDDENYAKIHDLSTYNKSLGHTENLTELKPLNKTAADYSMYAPDLDQKELNPVGEWNTSRIVFTPEKVEHWLNGKKVVSFEPWSEDWQNKKNSGKWEGSPDYGKFKTGYIGLQDHQSSIWFKNIKIRKL